MAKGGVALALLLLAFLSTGSLAARLTPEIRQASRRILQGSATAGGSASGSGDPSESINIPIAISNPLFSAAADASANVAEQPDGQVSVDTSDAFGDAFKGPNGQSQSQSQAQSSGNGVPGSSSNAGVNVAFGGADSGASAGSSSG